MVLKENVALLFISVHLRKEAREDAFAWTRPGVELGHALWGRDQIISFPRFKKVGHHAVGQSLFHRIVCERKAIKPRQAFGSAEPQESVRIPLDAVNLVAWKPVSGCVDTSRQPLWAEERRNEVQEEKKHYRGRSA